ncbi:MAG: NADH-quinone oxidoreductase subunit N [Chthoniobacteraceae bacterium]
MNYLELLRLISPEAIITLTALALLGLQFITPRARDFCIPMAALGIITAILCVKFLLPANATLCGEMIVVTPLTSLFKTIILLLAFFTVLLARDNSFTRHPCEYLALILFATMGLMLLVGSGELLMIFIGLELTGLSLYILTAFNKSDILAVEAGLKYFLFGSTASAFTLFGISLIYGMCGSTSLMEIGHRFSSVSAQPLLIAGVVMTLAGFAFKIAAAPFHLWAADTYQAAPIPSAAFIASGSKVASFFVLGNILLVGFKSADAALWQRFDPAWFPIVAIIAALSIILGNLVALAQRNLRRLLAYSAVAHAGYTLLGLLATGPEGFAATLFYTTIYAFTLIGTFGVIALVRRATGGDDIANFTGLAKRSPLLAACTAIFLLSLAGLPPFAGFFGKFYLFTALLHSGESHAGILLVTIALAGSLVSLYYYLSVLRVIFVDSSPEPGTSAIQMDAIQRITLALLSLAIVILGLFPDLLAALITNAIG